MYQDIFSKILNYPYFSVNSQITKDKILIIINNLNYWEFNNPDEVKIFMEELNKNYPNHFFRVPETSNYVNLKLVDYVKMNSKFSVTIKMQNINHGVKFNLGKIQDENDLFDDCFDSKTFITILETSSISFLNYNYDQNEYTTDIYINTDNVDHVHNNLSQVPNKKSSVSIVFKGTNPNTLEYKNRNKIDFSDLVNNFKKSQFLKKCL